ncbi:MAG: peroxiredoxin [Magnetococcales bacterium]|nr:peroxiredoxin [Magnetococcales bacterium]MBF0114610.1 peroxiredoxin [Magnetococcales bacterium]
MLEPGQPIPNLSLPDQQDKQHLLPDLLAAKGAVFYFYPRDNTPGCSLEANDFQTLLPQFTALGVAIVGISKDSIPSHQKFCLKYGLTFTLLSDGNGQACQDFGVWQEKKNYGKVSMGIVRTTFIVGAEGVVQRVYRNVRTNGHAQQVLLDLQKQLSLPL